MSRAAGGAREPRSPEVARKLRRTGWVLLAVIVSLAVGAACFIAKYGRKSRTVLHSELAAASARAAA
jgi:amino acid permease